CSLPCWLSSAVRGVRVLCALVAEISRRVSSLLVCLSLPLLSLPTGKSASSTAVSTNTISVPSLFRRRPSPQPLLVLCFFPSPHPACCHSREIFRATRRCHNQNFDAATRCLDRLLL